MRGARHWRVTIAVAAWMWLLATPAGAALTASVANLTLPSASYSHANQTKTGTMTLTASDTCELVVLVLVCSGWNVTILSSSFSYSGSNSGSAIPAANLSLTSAATPVRVSGEAVDSTRGPKVPSLSPLGPLNVPRKVVQTEDDLVVDYGKGTYTQALGVSLVVPEQSRAGTYTGTLTVTMAVGP